MAPGPATLLRRYRPPGGIVLPTPLKGAPKPVTEPGLGANLGADPEPPPPDNFRTGRLVRGRRGGGGVGALGENDAVTGGTSRQESVKRQRERQT